MVVVCFDYEVRIVACEAVLASAEGLSWVTVAGIFVYVVWDCLNSLMINWEFC